MKKLLLIAFLLTAVVSVKAQDIIIFTNGDEVEAKVTEVSDTEVKYKSWSNQSGPTWVKKTSDIFMIRYENGTKQTFSTSRTKQPQQQPTPQYTPQRPVSQPVAPANLIKSRNIDHSLCVGLKIKEGYNRISFSPEDNILDFHGVRWTPSFAAYLDYYPKQEQQGANPFLGIGLELMYANRGGTIKKNFEMPTTINLSYWALRPSFSIRDNLAFLHLGVDFSFVSKATWKDDVHGEIDLINNGYYNFANSPLFGVWCDFGLYIGKYITLDLFADFTFADLSGQSTGVLAPELFQSPATSFNCVFGLSLGILLTPMKITVVK